MSDLGLTVSRECFMAMMAAMKKVLSPISEARIIPHDFRNPCNALQAISRKHVLLVTAGLQVCCVSPHRYRDCPGSPQKDVP